MSIFYLFALKMAVVMLATFFRKQIPIQQPCFIFLQKASLAPVNARDLVYSARRDDAALNTPATPQPSSEGGQGSETGEIEISDVKNLEVVHKQVAAAPEVTRVEEPVAIGPGSGLLLHLLVLLGSGVASISFFRLFNKPKKTKTKKEEKKS